MSLIQDLNVTLNATGFEHPSDRSEAIDAIRIKAGAALHQAGAHLDNIATKMALRHVCDIGDSQDSLTEISDMLRDGGNKVAFFDATDAGQVDKDTLPGKLNAFFGPIAAYDPEQEKLQISQAEAAVTATDAARAYIRSVIDMRFNDLDVASEILFAAAGRCREIPASMTPASMARTA